MSKIIGGPYDGRYFELAPWIHNTAIDKLIDFPVYIPKDWDGVTRPYVGAQPLVPFDRYTLMRVEMLNGAGQAIGHRVILLHGTIALDDAIRRLNDEKEEIASVRLI